MKPITSILTMCVLMSLASTATAAICTVPGTHPDIQTAVDDTTCDAIELGPLVFHENVTTTRSIDFIGQTDPCASGRATVWQPMFAGQPTLQIGASGVISGPTVMLKHITFENGANIDKDGGAIAAYGATLTLDAVRVTTSLAWRGGGLYGDDHSTVVIQNACFDRNQVIKQSNSQAEGCGGAIFARTLFVEDTSTTLNMAEGDGGAICSDEMVANRTTIAQNYATDDGGGIYLERISSNFALIADSVFDFNTSDDLGGGLYHHHGNLRTLLFQDNILTGNSALVGGGIYAGNTHLLSERNTFDHNEAAGRGGGVHYTGDAAGLTWWSTQDTWTQNEAGRGGGVNATSFYAQLRFTEAHFANNQSTIDVGGGICLTSINDTTFDLSTFEDNTSATSGGAIATMDAGGLTIDASTFERNKAHRDGGAIHLFGATAHLVHTTLKDNLAENHGGAIASPEATLTLTTSTLLTNAAQSTTTARGGHVFSKGDTTIERCAFVGGVAIEGGALYHARDDLEITNSTFSTNEVTDPTQAKGGAVMLANDRWYRPSAILTLNSFVDNLSAADAGALYVDSTWQATLSHNAFQNNGTSACTHVSGVTMLSSGYNVEEGADCLAGFSQPTDQQTTPPGLLSIDTTTWSHLPGGASAVVDIGGTCPVEDQVSTGVRPSDGDGDGIAACDAGARER